MGTRQKLFWMVAILFVVASAPVTMMPSAWWRTAPPEPIPSPRDAPFWERGRACSVERQRLDAEAARIEELTQVLPQWREAERADRAYWLKVKRASLESATGDYARLCR